MRVRGLGEDGKAEILSSSEGPLKVKGSHVNHHWKLAQPRTPGGGVLAVGDTQGGGQGGFLGGGSDVPRGPVRMRRRG